MQEGSEFFFEVMYFILDTFMNTKCFTTSDHNVKYKLNTIIILHSNNTEIRIVLASALDVAFF